MSIAALCSPHCLRPSPFAWKFLTFQLCLLKQNYEDDSLIASVITCGMKGLAARREEEKRGGGGTSSR